MPQAQSVTCALMFAAGSRYETRETSGIAHFAEHMFFKGTERRPSARQIAGEIDSIGGEFNAFTGKELTGYYVKCAAEHRDVALDVLVDMLRHSRFEGIFRKHMLVRGGDVRDSAYYAIVDDEWPEVKENLRRRLAGR